MGIPETIIAAGIGGAATVTAALFHLYSALRVTTKTGQSPKRPGLLRSSLVIAPLMIASAAGGYVFAEFRQQRALDDTRAVHDELRAMRDEISAQLLVLAQTTEHLARDRAGHDERRAETASPVLASAPADPLCDETSGGQPTVCEAAAPPAPATPAVVPLADDGLL